jgi:hypothetical protein
VLPVNGELCRIGKGAWPSAATSDDTTKLAATPRRPDAREAGGSKRRADFADTMATAERKRCVRGSDMLSTEKESCTAARHHGTTLIYQSREVHR